MTVNERFRKRYKIRYLVSLLLAIVIHGAVFLFGTDFYERNVDEVAIYTMPKDRDNMKLVNISITPPIASIESNKDRSDIDDIPEEPDSELRLDFDITPPSIEKPGVETLLPPPVEVDTEPIEKTVKVPDSAPYLINSKEVISTLRDKYPSHLLERNESSTIIIDVHVSRKGEAIDATLNQSSGNKKLDDAVFSILDIFSFEPAINKNGDSLNVWVKMPIRFVPVN